MAACKGFVLVLLFIGSASSSSVSVGQCHCATSSACSGYPDVTCEDCEQFWSGPTCQTNNIARGDLDTTRASDRSSNSGRVVDGEKSGHPARCTTISDESGVQASWSLILNKKHEIHGMKIYFQPDNLAMLEQFEIRIGAALCKRWPEDASVQKELDVTCDRPLTGDLVSISIPLSDEVTKTLAICEVEIFECGDYWYGDNCSSLCNCADNTEVCNKRDGSCVSGTRETTQATSRVPDSEGGETSRSEAPHPKSTATSTAGGEISRSEPPPHPKSTATSTEGGEISRSEPPPHPKSTGGTEPRPLDREHKSGLRSVTVGELAGLIVGTILLLTLAIIAIILVIKMKFVRRPKVTNETFYPVSPVRYINRNYDFATGTGQTGVQRETLAWPPVLPPITTGK